MTKISHISWGRITTKAFTVCSRQVVKFWRKSHLNYSNFAILEFYIIILSSVLYQSSEAVTKNIDKLFELLNLLVEENKNDKTRTYTSLFKAILISYSEFAVNYLGFLIESSTKERCSNLLLNNYLIKTHFQ